jgi:hypothetical protein
MQRFLNALVLGSILTAGIVQSFGCAAEDGPAEEAGEAVDEAVDDMKDKVD